MKKTVISLLSVFIMSQILSASETLFTVSTINSYNLKNKTIVSFDYDQNDIAELFLFDIESKTKKIIPFYGSVKPNFLLSGFNGKEVVYVNFNTSYEYYIDYYSIESKESKRLVSDGSYKEFIWCSDDKMVWIDYRDLGGSSTNSEVYMLDLGNSIITRITNDTYYQSKAVIDGKYIVWIEYRNSKYGNIVLYDIETKQRFFIDPVNYHQDNPKIAGNFIVWEDYRNTNADPKNSDIYLYDIANKEVRAISTAEGFQGNPYIYKNPVITGAIVVWEDYKSDNSNSDINSYNLNTSEYETIASEPSFESHPQIDQPLINGANVIIYTKIENDIISFEKEEKYFNGVIDEQASNSDECEGSNAIFSVKIIDDIRNLENEIQWYKGTEKLIENTKYSGVNDTILTINNIDVSDSGSYHLEITLIEANKTFISNNAVLNVKQAPRITSQPSDTMIVWYADSAIIEISVSGTEPLEYQWYKDDKMLSDYSNAKVIIEDFVRKDTGDYYCRIINVCDTTFSNIFHLKLNDDGQPPLIITQPEEYYLIKKGGDLTISIEAIGTPELKFEWYKNNILMPDDTTNIYHISNVSYDDKSSYYCKVSNIYGSEISDTALVEITTGVGVNSQQGLDNYILYENKPNPFNDYTNITFYIPNTSFVKVAIYDLLSNEKGILVNKVVESGLNEFRFRTSDYGLSPGVFFYSLFSKDILIIKKMIIIK